MSVLLLDEPPFVMGKESVTYARLRLASPYDIVANVVMQTTSGATHLPCLIAINGKRREDPMFECGLNSAAKPKKCSRIDGPTLVTCRRCTMVALMRLGRRGLLKWSACAKKASR